MATATVTNTLVDATTITVGPLNTNFSDLVTFLNTNVLHLDGSKTMTADLAMGSNKITGLAAPSSANDAARKTDLDSQTHAAGDITSGTLAIARIPTGTTSSTVSLGNHNHSSTYLALTGGTLTGAVTFPSGSYASPSVLVGDTDVGLYSDTTNALQVRAGTVRFIFSGNGDAFYPHSNGATNLGLSGNRWDTVYAATGTINTSDEREKDILGRAGRGLFEVLHLDPIMYRWKPELGRGDEVRLGFSAQETRLIVPEAVVVPDDPQDMLGLNSDQMLAVLWRAVQELADEVERLRSA